MRIGDEGRVKERDNRRGQIEKTKQIYTHYAKDFQIKYQDVYNILKSHI